MNRIVIVDDQRLVREGLAELLSSKFEVAGLAANGAEAVELCQKTRPNLAIVDVVMPVMNGPTCTRALLADNLVERCLQ